MSEQQSHVITVALIPEVVAALKSVTDRSGLNQTDTVNRAVSLYDFIDTELADGAELLLRKPDGGYFKVDLF